MTFSDDFQIFCFFFTFWSGGSMLLKMVLWSYWLPVHYRPAFFIFVTTGMHFSMEGKQKF